MEAIQKPSPAVFGWLGFVLGAAALVLAVVVIWAGPFAPQQAAGITLGELAADIAKSAARSVAGVEQPAPQAMPWTLDDTLNVVVSAVSALGVILGVAALIRHEPRRPAIAGIALGGASVAILIFTAWVFMIVGALIVMSIMYAFSETFGSIFGGL